MSSSAEPQLRRTTFLSRSDCWAKIVRLLDHWPDIDSYTADRPWERADEIRSLVWLAGDEQEQP